MLLDEAAHEIYHAYGRGSVIGVYTEIRDAVKAAYAEMGVVTNQNGQVVWERGNRKTRSVLELADGIEQVEAADSLEAGIRILLEQEGVYTDARSSLDSGRSAFQILKQHSNKHVENFTGCNLNSVLYYVSEGEYVLVMTDATHAEIIAGYDSQNIFVVDPLTGKMTKIGQKDAAAKYEALGHVFFSFLND